MANPTRPEIEAVVTLPTYTVEWWDGAAWTALSDDLVLEVSGAAESAGGESGITFGAEATARATIRLDPQADVDLGSRVRVRYGFAASDQLTRVLGVIESEDREAAAVTWTVAGLDTLIARTAVFSPLFYRRPAATATSASSVEDPSDGGYAGGLVNYILWTAGGRPVDQIGSYANALFYYACDTSLIVPEWSWAAGENAWDELGRLARACGLMIYQAADGVVRCQHALNLAGSGSYHFTTAVYGDLRSRRSQGERIGTVRCRYTARRLQPRQVVYEDTTPRAIGGMGTLTLTLEMPQPVYDYEADGTTLPADTVTGCTTEGIAVSQSAAIDDQAAAQLTITITNEGNDTMIVSRIQIRGRPIVVTEEGQVSYGSGTPEREIGGDTGVYVQTRAHAERICRLYADFYGAPLPVYTASGCAYDPDRTVGEAVLLTGLDAASLTCRITAIRHADTGATMEVDLVQTSTLPQLAETFIIGTAYAGGDTRTLGY